MKRSTKSTSPVEHNDGGQRSERTSLPGERVRSGMSPSSNDTARADPPDPGSEQLLLNRVRRGSPSAVDADAVRTVCSLAAETSPRPPAAVGTQRGCDQRSGAGRAASHLRTAQLVRVEARQRLARLSPARRGEPRPGRDASVHSTSGHRPPRPEGRNPCGPSRMRRRSINNSCTMRYGGVTGRA